MPAAHAVSRHLLPTTLALALLASTGAARATEVAATTSAAPGIEVQSPGGSDGPALDSLRRTAPRPEEDEGGSMARLLLFFGLGWVAASALRRRR